jgi:tRNA-dihydrouridine synthase 2
MGAALLTNPDLACDIVRTLCAGVSVPVSVKIRLLETTEQTVELAKRLEAAGAAALTVHARLRSTSPKNAAMWEQLRPIVDVSKTMHSTHDCVSSNAAQQR